MGANKNKLHMALFKWVLFNWSMRTDNLDIQAGLQKKEEKPI